MTSKTIRLTEDTYNKLLAIKRANESFNDLILRIIGQKQDLLPYAGLLTPSEGDRLEKAFDEIGEANERADSD